MEATTENGPCELVARRHVVPLDQPGGSSDDVAACLLSPVVLTALYPITPRDLRVPFEPPECLSGGRWPLCFQRPTKLPAPASPVQARCGS
ncbi:hypothetical protein PC116_g16109 [Phytophthora cactorum]|nr:hypothetical protein PC116_g16109 [Phytophthora cactorum]